MKEEKKKLSYYQRKKQGLLNPRDGRPSSYKPEYCEQIIEYFDQEPHRDVLKKRMTTKDGTEIEEFEMRATDPRFIIGFSRLVGVTRKTLLKWAEDNKEFKSALEEAKLLQGQHIKINSFQKNFATSFAIFAMKNMFGWRDTQHIEEKIDHTLHAEYKEMSNEQLDKEIARLEVEAK